jgi:phosphoglycerol transferase MdoB-like AlkP superfamily enzyme
VRRILLVCWRCTIIIGLSIHTFTIIHVIISLVAIASGIVVLVGMLGANRLPGWTALFLVTTILTSVTGFMFPINGFTPAIGTGIVSILVLGVALIALYAKHLVGSWRWIYVTAAATALYFNVLVLIVQSFQKVPALHALAPTQSEPPFLIAQGSALVVFLVVGFFAASRFRLATDVLAR